MRFLFAALFVCLTLLSPTLQAQAGNPAAASEEVTLRQQFDDMVRVSNRYQRFRVVRQDFLDAFIGNVTDSLSGYTEEIGRLNATITEQKDRIEGLTGEVADRDGSISALTSEKDSISLLGVAMSKTAYSTLLWSLIFGLLALLIFVFLRMRVALAGAREANRNSEQLTEDLAKAKRRRLEVEQTLGRKLQDEINKNRSK